MEGDTRPAELLVDVGEYGLHAILESQLNPAGRRVVGDDCAVYEMGGDQVLLINVDRLPSGVPLSEQAARLCVVHTLSDIVCMGGTPEAFLVALTLPRDTEVAALTEFTSALRNELARYGASLVGGDTKEGPAFHMVGVGLGRAPRPSLVRRVGAQPGMLLGVTSAHGRPWGTRWAHAVISQLGLDLPQDVVDHCRAADPVIELPLVESRAVVASGHARAGLDLSDGIGGGARIIARSSVVGVNLSSGALTDLVDPELAPVAQALDLPLACFALSPGYNWENLYAIDADAEGRVRSAVKSAGGAFTIIGSVVEGEALMIDGRAFDHDVWPMDEKFVKQHAWEDRLDTWRQKCRTVLDAAG